MSTIAELKDAVKANLSISLNVTDSFQGEADSNDVDTLVDEQILRAANNARLWAERQHDFAENDVAVRLFHNSGIPSLLAGCSYENATEREYDWRLIPKLIKGASTAEAVGIDPSDLTTGNIIFRGVNNDLRVSALTLAQITDVGPRSFNCNTFINPMTAGTYINQYFFSQTAGAVNSSYLYGPMYRLKTINAAYLTETGGALRPIWVKSKKRLALEARKNLDLETAEPYIRYPGDEDYERDQIKNYLVHQGDKVSLYPPQDATLVIEGNRWMSDYVADTDTDFILQHGFDWMMWAVIVDLNHIFQTYVPRQEGSLPPPVRIRDEAWLTFVGNDEYRFEGSAALE